jgi:glutamine cyclotransferase
VTLLQPEILDVRPHDTGAYTQGLLLHDGSLYESTGRNGESTLRQVDLQTGEVLRSIDVPEEYFAEGLERVDDTLIQLTWKSEVAFVYDLATFDKIGEFTYSGEGWGLCSDGSYLYMSDGSPFIDLRDRETFEPIVSFLVTVQGQMVEQLNELECVGDYIYANVWQTDFIVKIDKRNGVVVSVIDASNLLTAEERATLGRNCQSPCSAPPLEGGFSYHQNSQQRDHHDQNQARRRAHHAQRVSAHRRGQQPQR